MTYKRSFCYNQIFISQNTQFLREVKVHGLQPDQIIHKVFELKKLFPRLTFDKRRIEYRLIYRCQNNGLGEWYVSLRYTDFMS